VEAKEVKTSEKLFAAEFISRFSNPTILSVLMLLAVLFAKADRLYDLVRWSLILIVLLVVLPLLYVFFRVKRNQDVRRTYPGLTLFLKRHPRDILLLGLICGVPCSLILRYMDAPPIMMDTMTALLVIAVLIAFMNLFYRASFHLAAITTLVYMAVIIWGNLFLVLVLIIPVVAWAKFKLKDHTPLQLMIGFILAILVPSIITQI
jgi:hypothetical protein